jgi:ATP-dependent helicase HrpB
LIEGRKRRVAEESTLLAALLSERDIRSTSRTSFGSRPSSVDTGASGESDLLDLLDCFHNAEAAFFESQQVLALGLDPGAIQAVRKGVRQLQRLLLTKRKDDPAISPTEAAEGLRIAILAAFPDRVCKRRKPNSRELLLAGGGSAMLSTASVVHHPVYRCG